MIFLLSWDRSRYLSAVKGYLVIYGRPHIPPEDEQVLHVADTEPGEVVYQQHLVPVI